MCGRFTLKVPFRVLKSLYDLTAEPGTIDLPQLFNIAPTQSVPAVRAGADGGRHLDFLKWGLVPSWAKDPGIGSKMINARAEGVETKPAFRSAIKRRRCLVPANGFYEWHKQGEGKSKQPYYIRMADGAPFSFAGLWEFWKPEGDEEQEGLATFTIITTAANELMERIHDRMPVILPQQDYAVWLDPQAQDPERVTPLLRPYPAEGMEAYPVSTRVNNPRNDGPELIKAIAAGEEQAELF